MKSVLLLILFPCLLHAQHPTVTRVINSIHHDQEGRAGSIRKQHVQDNYNAVIAASRVALDPALTQVLASQFSHYQNKFPINYCYTHDALSKTYRRA